MNEVGEREWIITVVKINIWERRLCGMCVHITIIISFYSSIPFTYFLDSKSNIQILTCS